MTGNTLLVVLPMRYMCCTVGRPHESFCVGRVDKWFGQQSRITGRRLADSALGLLARFPGVRSMACRLLTHLLFLTFTSLKRCSLHAVRCIEHYVLVRKKSLSSLALI